MSHEKKYNIAIVTDPLYKKGGTEIHLKYILDTFNNKTVYTPFYDKEFVKKEFPNIEIKASFMQYLPFKSSLRNFYTLIQPFAYKTFKFENTNLILSFSKLFAKFATGAIPHISICVSPPKFLWEEEIKGIKKYIKKLDKKAAQKVDKMVAISNYVKKRIKEYYEINADVIHTPIDVTGMCNASKGCKKENWFLYLGKIEKSRGIELAIRAACDAKVPLKIAGVGNDLERMKSLVKELNAKGLVKFLGYYSDEEKPILLARARALLFPVKGEDFGKIAVEANSSGTPVIAYREGGVVETISESNPKTGILFDQYDYKDLSKILKKFDDKEFNSGSCKKQAANFASEIFQYKLKTYVEDLLDSNKK